jgi:probable rRNA maturation factor
MDGEKVAKARYNTRATVQQVNTPALVSFEVSIQVLEDFDGLASEAWLKHVAESALAVASPESDAGLSVVIADDAVVRELNMTHRGLDENTDVLAFSFAHGGEYYGDDRRDSGPGDGVDFVLPPEQRDTLGEIIISYDKALKQAAQAGHPLETELAVLLAHGVLHLLGHDHLEPDDEAAMKDLERQVMARVWQEA